MTTKNGRSISAGTRVIRRTVSDKPGISHRVHVPFPLQDRCQNADDPIRARSHTNAEQGTSSESSTG